MKRFSSVAVAVLVAAACSAGSDRDDVPGAAGEASQVGGTGGAEAVDVADGGRHAFAIACTMPTLDPKTGLVECEEGYRHRPSARACAVARSEGGAAGADGWAELPRANREDCESDPSVCDNFYLGWCRHEPAGLAGAASYCTSGCATDADCGSASICVCDADETPGGTCQDSDCKTDADCGEGFLCASYASSPTACWPDGFACQRADDACATKDDCRDGYCTWRPIPGHRSCDTSYCTD